MKKRKFHANIAGRVAKIKTQDFLVPLYEAISNSIHSIEDSARNGTIEIEFLREPRQMELSGAARQRELPITGFIVTDTGLGFTEANVESFCEADSTSKATVGGKGVARFSWLKFFERATVESVYSEVDGKKYRRTFTFSTTGVDDEDVVEVNAPFRTRIQLGPLRLAYELKTRKTLEDIAISIIEQFLAYFVTGAMPTLKLRDGAAQQDVRELYQSSIGRNTLEHAFDINGHAFHATGIKFYLGTQGHTVFLCGHKRAADRAQLGKRDAFFSHRFTDPDLRKYAFHVFIESPYLDELVHDDRDGFRFPDPGILEVALGDGVTKEAITEQALHFAREIMEREIGQVKASNVQIVTSFVMSEAPQYRHLLVKHKEALASIHDTDPVKIDQALRRIQFEDELRTRTEMSALMRQAEEIDIGESEEWQQKSAELLAKLSEEGKANLANYIVHRKRILELLQKRMELVNDTRAREAAVHKLIFPMRSTSDEVGYERQNLWIIDERLSYHYYLASDKPLSSMEVAESDSKKEPDVIVFNRPIALNDRAEGERLESIVIIEFKRPGESSVDGQRNPVQQIQEYIELIQAGPSTNTKGSANPSHARNLLLWLCDMRVGPDT